jgi:tripartite-type tricarboxylate transporter receptor subunit TctC
MRSFVRCAIRAFTPVFGGLWAPGQRRQNLLAGQLDTMITVPSMALPAARAGRVRIYAVAAPARTAVAPDVLTVDEMGLPGFYLSVWHAL